MSNDLQTNVPHEAHFNEMEFSEKTLKQIEEFIDQHGLQLINISKEEYEWSAQLRAKNGDGGSAQLIMGPFRKVFGKTFNDLFYNLELVSTFYGIGCRIPECMKSDEVKQIKKNEDDLKVEAEAAKNYK